MPNTKPTVINGVCEVNNNTATLTCNIGYQPEGLSTSNLKQVNGLDIWDPPELKCIPMTINYLPSAEHGIVTAAQRSKENEPDEVEDVQGSYQIYDTARPKCENGYEFTGTASLLTVSSSGTLQWVPSVLQCTPKAISEPPIVVNGTVHEQAPFKLGTTVTVKCNDGYEAKSLESSELIVDPLGQLKWSPASLSCEPMTLNDDPEIVNGTYIFNHDAPFFFKDRAEVNCYPGFESSVPYAEVIQQGTHLVWKPQILNCQPMTLNAEPTIQNGTYFFQLKPGEKQPPQAPYLRGTKITIQCHADHHANETESTVVLDSQTGTLKWRPDNILCKPSKCPEPPVAPIYGSRDGSGGRDINHWVKYACSQGLGLVGIWKTPQNSLPLLNSEYKCNAVGKWAPDIPDEFKCEPAICPELKAPAYGYLQYSQVEGGIATYKCLNKTIFTRTCQADGSWSGKPPRCPPVPITRSNYLIWILPFFMLMCLMLFTIIRLGRPKT